VIWFWIIGFSNDPTAVIDKYVINNTPIYDEVLYEKQLTNSQIAKRKKRFIVADSAEPKSIAELSYLGLQLVGAKKGVDSVFFGIQTMQDYEKFYVTARSFNLISELRKYRWQTDRLGANLNVPIDDFNHGIDAIRYAETHNKLRPKVKVIW